LMAKVKDINFLAERNIKAREKRKTIILIVALVLVFSAVTLVPYGYLQWYLLQGRQELAQMQSKYRQVKETANQTEELIKKRTASEDQVKQLMSLIEGRSPQAKMLKELAMSVPGDVWLISLEIKYEARDNAEEEQTSDHAQIDQESTQNEGVIHPSPNQVAIKGKSIGLEHIGRFIYKLNGLPYFSKVDLQEINRDMGTGGLNFTIMAPLQEGASHAK